MVVPRDPLAAAAGRSRARSPCPAVKCRCRCSSAWSGGSAIQVGHRAAQVLRSGRRSPHPTRFVLPFLNAMSLRIAAAGRAASPVRTNADPLALQLGQVAGTGSSMPGCIAVGSAQQQRHSPTWPPRTRVSVRVTLAAGEILLVHDATVAQHDQRDRALLLQPGPRSPPSGAAGSFRRLGRGRQRHRLAGWNRCVVEVLMVGGSSCAAGR